MSHAQPSGGDSPQKWPDSEAVEGAAPAKPPLAPPAHSRVVQPAGQAAGNQVSELLVVHLAAGVAIHLEVLQGAGMGLQWRCDENKVVEAALVGQLKVARKDCHA